MNDNQAQNGGMNLGELSTIRNILMGQQMAEYEQAFGRVHQTINQKEIEATERLQDLENRMNERLTQLERDMNARFDRLEALLAQNVQQLNERVSSVSTSDKAELGKMLAGISRQLLGE